MGTTLTSHPAPPPTGVLAPPGRWWARAGILAGLGGIAMFVLTGAISGDTDLLEDNARLAEWMGDRAWVIWVFQALTSATALAVVAFAAGLRRRLDAQSPVGSLVPTLASTGLGLVAALLLVGGGISTELFFHLLHVSESDPDTIGAAATIFNTMAWVWAGAGLAAGAVAYAAFKYGSFSRWIGWVSAVCAGLVALVQIVPLQYMALAPGALWFLALGTGFTRQGGRA